MILLAQWHRYILGHFSNFTFADIRYLYEIFLNFTVHERLYFTILVVY